MNIIEIPPFDEYFEGFKLPEDLIVLFAVSRETRRVGWNLYSFTDNRERLELPCDESEE
jgi:hypothetical protein